MLNLHFFTETIIPLISHSSFHRIKISYVAKLRSTIFVMNKVYILFLTKARISSFSSHPFISCLFSFLFIIEIQKIISTVLNIMYCDFLLDYFYNMN